MCLNERSRIMGSIVWNRLKNKKNKKISNEYTRHCVCRCCTGYRATQKREYCLFKSESAAASATIEPATNISTAWRIVSVGTTIQHIAHLGLIAIIYKLFSPDSSVSDIFAADTEAHRPARQTVVGESAASISKSSDIFLMGTFDEDVDPFEDLTI